jgi:hypothetical protein
MFRQRQRPGTRARPTENTPTDWIHGFCYLARQQCLHFGSSRKKPVEWRPVISWKQCGSRLYVLPSTSQADPAYFHLKPDQCLRKRPRPEPPRDSYLYWVAELVEPDCLIELGILPHPIRIQIAKWLRQRM